MASHGVARPIQARTEGQRLQELDKIRTYRELEDQIRVQAESGTYDLALLQLTTKLLRLSPEYFTVWNVRRRCLISGLLSGRSGGALPSKASPSTSPNATTGPGPSSDASSLSSSDEFQPDQHSSTSMATADPHESDGNVLQSELAFTVPLLLRFPKSYWIWNFRRWILSQVILRLPVPIARKVWETELGLAAEMLDKDQRNFHAWAYRRYVVAKLESPELQGKSMAEDEFAYTTKLIGLDLSNFSAWHNRSQVVLRVLDERGADDEMRAAFLDKELSTVLDALNVGPDDQSLYITINF
ncbi:hypothetical protein GE09DRAFT_72725 [Coniochaeta sp. 2T2.1]|nr:hypothetical protein GE09DRAFT_72725 [Coniochaeta sp. 2T2.1]